MLTDISIAQTMRLVRPRSPNQLHAWVRAVLGFTMPRRPMIAEHAAPFDYLCHAFFERPAAPSLNGGGKVPRDCVVWAPRGGGKTQLGAIATLLDLLFKPGIQIRILGGSFEQSAKMHGYLKQLLDGELFGDLIRGHFTGAHVELVNGSRVEVLSQSQRDIRGQRVHKLRCDEVELFEPETWEAAQLVTRSGWCGDTFVHAAIEAFSTMHKPFGMMRRLVEESACFGNKAQGLQSLGPNCNSAISSAGSQARSAWALRVLFKWSALDVLERCGEAHQCGTCTLHEDCQGRAKTQARGFLRIDDAIQQKRRVGLHTWKAEMLCQHPSRSDSVYPEFDEHTHVIESPRFNEQIPNDEELKFNNSDRGSCLLAGLDPGFRAPTVLLLARYDSASDQLSVIDEVLARETTTGAMIDLVLERLARHGWPKPAWIGCDPAGHQRSPDSGLSTIAHWKRAGFAVRTRCTAIEHGVAAVRARLKRADGSIGLRVHRRCARLIEALVKYHYPPDDPQTTIPVKDGHDHACDALRYLVVNLDRGTLAAQVRDY